MNPLYVLQPNYMGDTLGNLGVGEIANNRGLGVPEALGTNAQAMAQKDQGTASARLRDNLRTAKAREFGKTKETVGF